MITREIEYLDVHTNEEVVETFYFHLNKAEMIRLMAHNKTAPTWEAYINEIATSNDPDIMMDFLEMFVQRSVGTRVDNKFIKPKNYALEFMAGNAWGEMFVSLITDESYAKKFFDAILNEGKGVKNTGKLSSVDSNQNGQQPNRAARRRNKQKQQQNHQE